jgi:hypothetical protein
MYLQTLATGTASRTRRDLMDAWATKKGPGGLDAYQQEKNRVSIDGLPTGLPTS